MALEPQTATAPSHWATYLVNGDSSGLEPAELEQANRFAEWLGGSIVSCEDAGFMWTHDAMRVCGALASDCQTFTALIESESTS